VTKSQRDRRFQRIREIGCLASRKRGWYVVPDVHHLNLGQHAGQKRRGDEFTIGLSIWHHRGIPIEGMSEKECRRVLGPSMKHEPVKFREVFGSDDELLAEENKLIAEKEVNVVGRVA
jgi:Recombination enhancement, RecA-dependent nuclease